MPEKYIVIKDSIFIHGRCIEIQKRLKHDLSFEYAVSDCGIWFTSLNMLKKFLSV
jgi:hypothetical protein